MSVYRFAGPRRAGAYTFGAGPALPGKTHKHGGPLLAQGQRYRFGSARRAGLYTFGSTARYHFGHGGLGVAAWSVAGDGRNGPSYLWALRDAAAGAFAEIRGNVETWPAAGEFFPYEDGSFYFRGAPAGLYGFTVRAFRAGVDVGLYSFMLEVSAPVTALEAATTAAPAPGPFRLWRGEGPALPTTRRARNSWVDMLARIAPQAGLDGPAQQVGPLNPPPPTPIPPPPTPIGLGYDGQAMQYDGQQIGYQ